MMVQTRVGYEPPFNVGRFGGLVDDESSLKRDAEAGSRGESVQKLIPNYA
jgi:hypothetical protein